MNCKMTKKMPISKALLLVTLLTLSAPTLSAEYWLRARAFDKNLGGGLGSVPMWGFASCTSNFAECSAPTVPGPALNVPAGDVSGLTVHLQNRLSEPVSMVINGQNLPVPVPGKSPVWTDGTAGDRTSATQRVRSFTHEAAATNGVATYSWPSIKPGTYLYQSGTHPQIQVQMGLYGALNHDALASTASNLAEAYAGVTYNQSATLLLSEIDPELHLAVANGDYGPAKRITSTLNYEPKYFLINGRPFTGGRNQLPEVRAGERTLLRFLNAGLRTRVPMINSGYFRLVAEDGNPYPWAANPRSQYTVLLPAAKTIDAIYIGQTPTGNDTNFVITDRRMGLNNAADLDGGMMAYLRVASVGNPPRITAPSANSSLSGMQELNFTTQVVATDPEGGQLTYSLDVFPVGMTISSTGAIAWTPNSTQAGNQLVTARVTDPTGQFVTRSFSINVAINKYPPVALADTYMMVQGSTLNIAAAGILANDTDGDSNPLVAVNISAASTGTLAGNVNGSFSYTPPTTSYTGAATFTYSAFDQVFTSAPATVTINVIADRAPVAVNDIASAKQRRKNTVYTPALINVLANDTDPDTVLEPSNKIDATTVVVVTKPTRGGIVTVNSATGDMSYTPALNFEGTDSFSYAVKDTLGVSSNNATVRINVRN